MLAENALRRAIVHVKMSGGTTDTQWYYGAQWHAEHAAKRLAATDGPRSVRTRARRLARRLARVLARVCD